MTNCIDINLHLNPLKEGIDIKSYGTPEHSEISLTDVNPKLINLFTSLDLKICSTHLFYTSPQVFSGIHIDAYGGDYTKINYVYGGKNSKMIWYKTKNNIKKSINTTCIGAPYIKYTISEVKIIEAHPINFPSIVQAGIPHNIVNPTEPRYCISMILLNTIGERLSMEDSIKIFSKYIIDI